MSRHGEGVRRGEVWVVQRSVHLRGCRAVWGRGGGGLLCNITEANNFDIVCGGRRGPARPVAAPRAVELQRIILRSKEKEAHLSSQTQCNLHLSLFTPPLSCRVALKNCARHGAPDALGLRSWGDVCSPEAAAPPRAAKLRGILYKAWSQYVPGEA